MAKGLTTQEFVEKARTAHNNRYDYSTSVYKNYLTPVKVICREHGEFEQKPNNHLNGAGCPICASAVVSKKLSMTQMDFISKAIERFGDSFTYERVEYINTKTPVVITCKTHGDFKTTPNAFLSGHTGCSACNGSKLTRESFIARAKLVHGDYYDYSQTLVAGYHGISKIVCREHGEFEQTPNNHLQGKGCPKCAGKMVSDTASFVDAAEKVHGDRYDYSLVKYLSSTTKVKIVCESHGVFEQTPANHLQGNGCPKCSPKTSKPESELFEFIKTLDASAEQSNRSIIAPLELDIVSHVSKIAIEFNGLHYHSDRNSGKRDTYHLDKMITTNNAGYRLIQVWEDDWRDRRSVVEKTLRHVFGASKTRVFARKCKITRPDLKSVAWFFSENHLQGHPRRGEVYALENNGEIVAAMVFHPVTSERGKIASEMRWELGRYASTCAVTGGASRLFKAFLADRAECVEVVSYSDNDWFDGGMYETLGFTFANNVPPDYKVVDGGTRRHKINYKLSELQKRLGDKFNPLLSERENCRQNGLYRVYNSGLRKWVWTR